MNRYWLAGLVGIALLAGCKRGVENEQAVRQAVDLARRTNLRSAQDRQSC